MSEKNGETLEKEDDTSEHEQILGILQAKNANPIELDPSRTALIVVDMQRYFTQAAFPFTDVFNKLSPGAASGYLTRVRETVIPSIQRLLTSGKTISISRIKRPCN